MTKPLWAPWRMNYIRGKKEKGCIFCTRARQKQDRNYFILERGKKNFVILNAFPYNSGHLMVVPYQHTGRLKDLSVKTLLEMTKLVKKAVGVLTKTFRAEGFNIGLNQGKIAGAGIADHLHMHVVPRWAADTNFMPLLSGSRILNEYLEETYDRLKKNWRNR